MWKSMAVWYSIKLIIEYHNNSRIEINCIISWCWIIINENFINKHHQRQTWNNCYTQKQHNLSLGKNISKDKCGIELQ